MTKKTTKKKTTKPKDDTIEIPMDDVIYRAADHIMDQYEWKSADGNKMKAIGMILDHLNTIQAIQLAKDELIQEARKANENT